ncbi:hypothetical protein FQA39_LY11932 [Lamprigera yunnana]|nr:hypothetical protein FQA39_LY11932 [Lamprigera yunnana]
MRVAVTLVVLFAVAHATPQFFQAPIAFIKNFTNFNNGAGEYSYHVETSDGQVRGEQRYLENVGTDKEHAVVVGYFAYNGTDGKEYFVTYKADEGGFQAEGSHIPPAADIQRQPIIGISTKAIGTLSGGGIG